MVYFDLSSIYINRYINLDLRNICDTDDRTSSSDDRIGRINYDPTNSCTAWLVNNATLITAGHCLDNGLTFDYVGFDIRASHPNGEPKMPSINDQYYIDDNSIIKADNGIGDDWAVFKCVPNSNTGLLPHQAQDNFFRVTTLIPSQNDD